jgi:hypothetical protein
MNLELEMPPTENNQKVGMFMTCIHLKDEKGVVIHNKCMSAIMEQR